MIDDRVAVLSGFRERLAAVIEQRGIARSAFAEEAGIEPLDVTALGCFDDGDRADAFYVASAWKGEPSNREPAEHSELAWVPLRQAAELPMAPTTGEALARLAAVVGSPPWLHPRR